MVAFLACFRVDVIALRARHGQMGNTTRLIETHDDIAEGLSALAEIDPRLVPVIAQAGPVPLRRKPAGFAALIGTPIELGALGFAVSLVGLVPVANTP